MYLVQVLSCCDNVTALGTNSSGQLAFQDPSQPYNPNTFWYVDQGFSPQGQPLGFVLRHMNTGNTLAAQANGTIVFKQINALDGWSTWTPGNVDQAFAMRPFADSELNFNIIGGCGKSELGLWQWGGGQNNEIWRLIFPSGTSAPKNNYKISSGCADFKGNHPPLALGDGGSVVCGTLDTTAATWNIEMQFAPGGVPLTSVSMVNVKNTLALQSNGQNQAACFGKFSANTSWTFGGGGPYVAVRPAADDDQNLNVFGGCGGGSRTVGTWGWGGGDPNEVWGFFQVD